MFFVLTDSSDDERHQAVIDVYPVSRLQYFGDVVIVDVDGVGVAFFGVSFVRRQLESLALLQFYFGRATLKVIFSRIF